MAIQPAVLMVELVMSIDRMIQSAKDAQTQAGEWTPSIILGHVSQVDEQVWMPRIRQMVEAHSKASDAPVFAWWEPDPVATAEVFKDVTLDEAAAHAMSVRTHLLSLVNDLTSGDWKATAKHDQFGEIDVAGLLFQVLTHDEEHRATLVGG